MASNQVPVCWMLRRKRDGYFRGYSIRPTDEQLSVAEAEDDEYVPLIVMEEPKGWIATNGEEPRGWSAHDFLWVVWNNGDVNCIEAYGTIMWDEITHYQPVTAPNPPA